MYRIIIVEDEAVMRKGLSCYIDWEDIGYELAGVFEDGSDAYEWLQTNSCDVILTDIMMERMSGLELAKRVREENPEILILILSGYAEFKYAQEAMQYGCKEYLLKPVSEKELASVLGKLKEELDKDRGTVKEDERNLVYRRFVMDIEARKPEVLEAHLKEYMRSVAYLPFGEQQEVLIQLCSNVAMDYKKRKMEPWVLSEGRYDVLKLKEQENYQKLYECAMDLFYSLMEGLAKQEKNQQEYAVELIKNYIHTHISEECGTLEIAQKYNVSTSYLCRMFKRRTGETLSDYILRMRMEKASELLKEDKYTISEVGAMVGYNYLGYFSTIFKKYMGYSPTQYRERFMKE